MIRRALVQCFSLASWAAQWNRVKARMMRRSTPIRDFDPLREFIESRASFVAQTALYGYLRTRAGIRYPTLFDNAAFGESVNIAKWHVWLACLSDLSVFAGGLLARRTGQAEVAGALMRAVVEAALARNEKPSDSGSAFAAHAQRVRARLALCNWDAVPDDATAFIESAPALVFWSPVAEELKQHDQLIVTNSIRFLWQDVRRELRRRVDAASLIASARASTSPA